MPSGSFAAMDRQTSPIRRLTENRTRWRVSVQTWPEQNGFHGRFVFEPDGARPERETREGPPLLAGRSREEVLRCAHDVTEARLRALLHSLG
jgi:hypothetical protein